MRTKDNPSLFRTGKTLSSAVNFPGQISPARQRRLRLIVSSCNGRGRKRQRHLPKRTDVSSGVCIFHFTLMRRSRCCGRLENTFVFFSITVPEQRPQPAVDFRDKIGIFRKKPHRVPPAPRKQAVLRDASDNSGGFLASELRPLSSPAGGHWGRVSLSLDWCRNFSVTPLNDGIS